MFIRTIRMKNFRNYEEAMIEPAPGVNILYGQNGSGKTNIIEAIHYCALGKSHRTSLDREVVRKDTLAGACGVTIQKRTGKEEIAIKLTPLDAKKKNVFIEKKKAQKISSLMGHLQCVIFSPEDLMLIKEGPSIRRKYMDMMISQIEPLYFVELQKYQRALDQRNAILREGKKTGVQRHDLLDVFEMQMASSSQIIIPMRDRMISDIQKIASKTYTEISGREHEDFCMKYVSCLENQNEIEKCVSEILKRNRQEDILKGTTSFGIHREDIKTYLQQKEMKLFASQGQIRTAALSMKLAQVELFKHETGESPVLLLDDVMSELDMSRRKRLIEYISDIQTFITCTDESDIELSERPRSFFIQLDEQHGGTITKTYNGITNFEVEHDANIEPDFS